MALTNTVTGKMKYLTIGSNTYEIEGGGDVSDVTVDGTSVVTNGVAEIDSEVMIVTITYNVSTEEYTADKTFTQIVNAISSGKYVVGKRHFVWEEGVEDDSTEDRFLSQASLFDDFGDVYVTFSEPIRSDSTKNGFTFYNIESNNSVYTYDDYTTIPTNKGFALYGTCSTTASTAAKVVTCPEFNLQRGTIIGVNFTTANTAATPTLNINNSGAKSIYVGISTPNATDNVLKWSANTMVYFQYDGTYFRYITSVSAGSVTPSRGANTWYGTLSTGASTQAKTSTIDNFVLTKGAVVCLVGTTANTYTSAKLTLNINSTGAKDIYKDGSITSSSNTLTWNTGAVLTFIYTGSYWYYVGKSVTKVSQLTNDSGYITSSSLPSITLNGSSATSPSFYAPTSAGTDGYYLKSNGSGAPTWASGGGDTVTWTQTQTTGTKIAAISINGASTDVYAPSGGVSGVKGNSESTYRTDNVNLTSANIGAVDLGDKYTRSSAGDLGWTSTTDGDAKVIAKSALAFWNGAYSGNSSNLSKCSTGNIIGSNGGTMTGQLLTSFKSSVAMGSYQAAATTVPNLANEIRFSSGCTGSVNIGTAYTKGSVTVPTGWYNFFYSPHRSGGVNGAASGDNCNYGTILLSGMTVSGLYRIRVQGSSDYVAELEKVYTSTTPYITAQGTTGSTWTYRKWSNGYQECWYHGSITFTTAGSSYQGWYRSTETISLPTATGFTAFADTATVVASGAYNGHVLTSAGLVKTNGTQLEVQILGGNAIAASTAVPAWNIYICGFARS